MSTPADPHDELDSSRAAHGGAPASDRNEVSNLWEAHGAAPASDRNHVSNLRAAAVELLEEHRIALAIVCTMMVVPKILFVFIPLLLLMVLYETAVAEPVRQRIAGCIPRSIVENRELKELKYCCSQIGNFVLGGAFLAWPVAIPWMFCHYLKKLFGRRADPKMLQVRSNGLRLAQKGVDFDAEGEENFYHSPAFAPVCLLFIGSGIPAFLTYWLFWYLGIADILHLAGLAKGWPMFLKLFYIPSIAGCIATLAARAWCTFPTHFLGNNHAVDLDAGGVRRLPHYGWFRACLTYNIADPTGSGFAWKEIKSVSYSDGRMYPLATRPFKLHSIEHNALEAVTAVTDGICRNMGSEQASLVFTSCSGKEFRVCLDGFSAREKMQLYEAITTWAPQVELSASARLALSGKRQDPDAQGYTSVWMQSLGIGRLARAVKMLDVGTLLEEGAIEIEQTMFSSDQCVFYKARQACDNSACVVKQILPGSAARFDAVDCAWRRYEYERSKLAEISHSMIVKLIRPFVDAGRPFMLLQPFAGIPLRQIVETNGSVPEREAIEIAIQMCNLAEELSGTAPDVVQNLMMPGNFVLQADGKLLLIDPGQCHDGEAEITSNIGFRAPEQIQGSACAQSCVYSIGAVLHFLLAASEPIALKCSNLNELKPSVDPRLSRIVATAAAYDLNERYVEARWMALELAELLREMDRPVAA